MTEFEDGLWERLVQEQGADGVSLTLPRDDAGRRPLMIGGGLTAVVAVTAVGVLGVGALTAAQPAYAMTENADGSYTVTINDVATAIPELNAKFAQMGIEETVVPVTDDCTNSNVLPLDLDPKMKMSDTVTLGPGRKYLDPGYTGMLAAEQLSNGEVATFMGAVKPPVPSCVSATTAISPNGTVGANGVMTLTETTVTPAAPTAGTSTAPTTTPAG